MADRSFDCVVIGSGPGGYVAAIRAAQLGMKTAVVEKDRIGGRCLNYACIPAKAILRVAEVWTEVGHGKNFGINVKDASVDMNGAGAHRDKVVKTLTGGVGMLMKKNNIDVIEGHGSVTDDGNVKIGGQFDGTEIEANTVVLATGSVPKTLLGLSFGGRVLGTETTWALNELPETLAVIGCGASGVEVGSAFGRLGTKVTLSEALAHKASDEGVIAVEDAAGMDTHPIEYDYIPRATFCYPQVASFGLTEKQAKEAGHDVVIGKIPMGAVGAGTVYGDRGGQIKIVGDKQYGELLGAHIVGVKAADMLQELVVAHDLEGGYPEVARSVHAHPTFSEAVMEAARAADGWLIHG